MAVLLYFVLLFLEQFPQQEIPSRPPIQAQAKDTAKPSEKPCGTLKKALDSTEVCTALVFRKDGLNVMKHWSVIGNPKPTVEDYIIKNWPTYVWRE